MSTGSHQLEIVTHVFVAIWSVSFAASSMSSTTPLSRPSAPKRPTHAEGQTPLTLAVLAVMNYTVHVHFVEIFWKVTGVKLVCQLSLPKHRWKGTRDVIIGPALLIVVFSAYIRRLCWGCLSGWGYWGGSAGAIGPWTAKCSRTRILAFSFLATPESAPFGTFFERLHNRNFRGVC